MLRQPMEPLPAEIPLIEMKGVMVRHDQKTVLNRVSWTVLPGEHWRISGPNGSGKSTLLTLVSGDNTQAYANGISLFGRKRGTGESVWDIKKRIGLVVELLAAGLPSLSHRQDRRRKTRPCLQNSPK